MYLPDQINRMAGNPPFIGVSAKPQNIRAFNNFPRSNKIRSKCVRVGQKRGATTNFSPAVAREEKSGWSSGNRPEKLACVLVCARVRGCACAGAR
jgi:hypothetical protein